MHTSFLTLFACARCVHTARHCCLTFGARTTIKYILRQVFPPALFGYHVVCSPSGKPIISPTVSERWYPIRTTATPYNHFNQLCLCFYKTVAQKYINRGEGGGGSGEGTKIFSILAEKRKISKRLKNS